MKLQKEIRNTLQILTIEGNVSIRDCQVLLAGAPKLIDSHNDWALDLSSADLKVDSREALDSFLLYFAAHCPGQFWVVGSHPWAHAATLELLEGVRSNPLLAASAGDDWFKERTADLQQRTALVSARIQETDSLEMLTLRRENSRLRRRLIRINAEAAAVESRFSSHSAEIHSRMIADQERIMTLLKRAVEGGEHR